MFYSIKEEGNIMNSQFDVLNSAKKWGFNVSNNYILCNTIDEVYDFVKKWEEEIEK